MTATLVTGAERGLGRETARRLARKGHAVWLGAREGHGGEQAAEQVGGRYVALDVTDPVTIAAAVDRIGGVDAGLDVLVNNAAIAGCGGAVADVTVDAVRAVLETNVLGLIAVTQAFMPLLSRSPAAVIVNVSSVMGSIAVTGDPARIESLFVDLAYPTSKAAVNMLTSQYARAYPEMRINCVDPGYAVTELHPGHGEKTVEEAAEVIVSAALLGPDGPTGAFLGADGPLPW